MQCLARRAIDLGYTTKYYRVSNLLEEIRVSRMAGTYTKTLEKISKFKLFNYLFPAAAVLLVFLAYYIFTSINKTYP